MNPFVPSQDRPHHGLFYVKRANLLEHRPEQHHVFLGSSMRWLTFSFPPVSRSKLPPENHLNDSQPWIRRDGKDADCLLWEHLRFLFHTFSEHLLHMHLRMYWPFPQVLARQNTNLKWQLPPLRRMSYIYQTTSKSSFATTNQYSSAMTTKMHTREVRTTCEAGTDSFSFICPKEWIQALYVGSAGSEPPLTAVEHSVMVGDVVLRSGSPPPKTSPNGPSASFHMCISGMILKRRAPHSICNTV